MSLCLDFFTVFDAKVCASFVLLEGSSSRFNSIHPLLYSFSQIVVTAFLCTLVKARDCLLVIAPGKAVDSGKRLSKNLLPGKNW